MLEGITPQTWLTSVQQLLNSGQNTARGYYGISVGMVGLSVIGPIGISWSELYAFVSLVQPYSAKRLNHTVHVIHKKNKSEMF